MNRRQFLASSVALALATFIKPAPRPIDLMQFCRKEKYGKWDMRLPYALEEHTFATDGFCCVRVATSTADAFDHKGPVPPFGKLSWNHNLVRGWREMPALQPLMAADSHCPGCDGTGYPGATMQECRKCEGLGHTWEGAGWEPSHPRQCKTCKGTGAVPPFGVAECRSCHGTAYGTFPTVVNLEGSYFDVRLYEKLRRLGGVEFILDNLHGNRNLPSLKARRGDDLMLLMGLDPVPTTLRLKEANP